MRAGSAKLSKTHFYDHRELRHSTQSLRSQAKYCGKTQCKELYAEYLIMVEG